MLPWRRGKFVLAKKEKKEKSVSLLPSFLRSCPHLLHQVHLPRLGIAFRRRSRTVELNREEPVYTAWYLGSIVTLHARGDGCTGEAVGRLWEMSFYGSRSSKVRLSVSSNGIRICPGKDKLAHTYLLSRITYCGSDQSRPRLLSWVYRHQVRHKAVVLRCHAVLLSRADKARSIALRLGQTSRASFCDFQRLQRQNDSRRGQQEMLGQSVVPQVPMRRLLNARCSYHTKEEKTRGTLSSIVEEEEEAEEVMGAQRCTLKEKGTVLELVQELRRLSIQRTLSQKLSCTYNVTSMTGSIPGGHLNDIASKPSWTVQH